MSTTIYPEQYLRFNAQQTKQLNVVLSIDGVSNSFGSAPTYTRVRYGDSGIYYGLPGLVYGGLRLLDNVKPYITLESALTFAQRLEPEQARASISTISFTFLDKDGYMSELISPGVVVDEILGREVTVRLGYFQTSFPEDYFVVFRGVITGTTVLPGKVTISLGDSNQKRRTVVFRTEKSALTAGISAVDTVIPVVTTTGFYDLLSVSTATAQPYIRIENEYMAYGYGALSPTSITVSSRGARGTTAVLHPINKDVSHAIQLTGNAIDLALKIMLSGWNGPWLTGVSCLALGQQLNPSLPAGFNVITLPIGKDADIDYGLVVGDSVTVSGSTAGNNGTYTITGFDDFDTTNRIIYLNTNLNIENPATSVQLAFRSKYDVLPTQCGLKLPANQVDIKTHEALRDQYFAGSEYQLQLFINQQKVGKDYIEQQIYLPIGAYSLTRYGRLSMGYTKPPIAVSSLTVIDADAVITPEQTIVSRGLNDRKFFNEIQYEWDLTDAGNYEKIVRALDTDSLNLIGLVSILPIKAEGVKTTLGGNVLASRIARRLLSRYKRAAYQIQCKVTWEVGSQIEVGDVVIVEDNGTLKITNLSTGERSTDGVLFEVLDRTMDVKGGSVQLRLVSGLDTDKTDRYGVISPSSKVSFTGSTTQVKIKTSYGATTSEYKKWVDYVGQKIVIHSPNWTTRFAERTLTGFLVSDANVMTLDSALPFAPQEDDIVEIPAYPNSTDKNENKTYKAVHAFIDPTLTVLVGLSNTQFTVSVSDAAKIQVGQFVLLHNAGFTNPLVERKVIDLTGTTVTVESSLGYTPSTGDKIELVGFPDNQGGYRLI